MKIFRCCAAAFALATMAAAPAVRLNRDETLFLNGPSAAGARTSSEFINQRMHYPGTAGDLRLAQYMRDRLSALGFAAHLETFRVTVFTPRVLALQLLTKPAQTFDLHEQPIVQDPDGSRADAGIPFNAGSGNGDVRAPLVFAGRGLEADYAVLAAHRVGVRGKIVLLRYGAEFRGNLAKRAQDHGAAGVIFYSDPQDDGFGRGPVYPNGRYRPMGAVQRGTVAFNDTELKIPTLPITATNAQRLLGAMRGAAGPAKWAGALHVRYVVGQTTVPVHLHVVMNATPTTLWNTVGELRGVHPNQSVILGGHRDAWVYGVTDNGSGISSLLEVARGLGALHRRGWTPQRTIRIVGFDGEEIGELGSQAYVSAHQPELKAGCVAYINLDEAASGARFNAAGAAALGDQIRNAARGAAGIGSVSLGPPGGGSDFEPFVYRAGVPVADIGFGGVLGTYHSAFDDFDYASRFSDPGFIHHRKIAQIAGLLAMRLADSSPIAYSFSAYVPVLTAGAGALVSQAQARNLQFDGAKLASAIARYGSAATRFDARASAATNARALRAVQALDPLAYMSNGYASVAFPKLAAGIASGNQKTLDDALVQTVAALDAVTATLR